MKLTIEYSLLWRLRVEDGKSTHFRVKQSWVLAPVLLSPSYMTLSKSFNPLGLCFITWKVRIIIPLQRADLRIQEDNISAATSTVPGSMLSDNVQ